MAKSYEASGKTIDEAIDNACALAGTSIENVEIEILELGGKGLFGIGQKDARVKVTVEKEEEVKTEVLVSTYGKKKVKKEVNKKKPEQKIEEIRPIIVVEPNSDISASRKKSEKSYSNDKRDGKRGPRRESHATMIEDGEMKDKIFSDFLTFAEPVFKELGVNPEYRTEIREGILWIILSGEKLGLLIGRRGETLNAIQYLVNLAVNKKRADHVRVVLDVEGYRESREQTLSALAHKMAEKAVRTGRRVELEPMNPHERRIVHIALQGDRRVETSSRGEEPYRRVVVSARRKKKNNHNQHSSS